MSGEHHLARLAERSFERHGDHESLFFEGRWYRSGELFERSCRMAAGLLTLGIEPGDRVVVLLSNSPDVGVVYSALWRAGAAITPLIFLVGPDELRRVLEHSGARAIVTSAEFLPSVVGAVKGLKALRHVVVSGGPMVGVPAEAPHVVSLEHLTEALPGEMVPRGDDDMAALMYTGGTTGRAKGVVLSHRNLWSCAKSSTDSSFVPGLTRTIVPLPLSHAFGLIATIVGMHVPEAGLAVLMRWFDPADFLRLVEEHRVQRATVVPSMLQILLGTPLEDHDLSSLQVVNCGAAPLPRETLEAFERRVPCAQILEGYGCTESGAVVSVNRPGERRLGTVGTPIPGYEVRIVDESGRPLPPGEIGEVCVRSPGVMGGYWKDPEASEQALRGGWLHTGDVGSVDEDGFLAVVDRMKDLIIRGGFNVFPRDVEDVLVEHPAVAMAGVVGRPDERYGEEIVAFVSLRSGVEATPEEIVAFARERLNATKYPREVVVLPAIPMTPVGKVDRKALRGLGSISPR
jgi:long-chain acyl-CoA synthetase